MTVRDVGTVGRPFALFAPAGVDGEYCRVGAVGLCDEKSAIVLTVRDVGTVGRPSPSYIVADTCRVGAVGLRDEESAIMTVRDVGTVGRPSRPVVPAGVDGEYCWVGAVGLCHV